MKSFVFAYARCPRVQGCADYLDVYWHCNMKARATVSLTENGCPPCRTVRRLNCFVSKCFLAFLMLATLLPTWGPCCVSPLTQQSLLVSLSVFYYVAKSFNLVQKRKNYAHKFTNTGCEKKPATHTVTRLRAIICALCVGFHYGHSSCVFVWCLPESNNSMRLRVNHISCATLLRWFVHSGRCSCWSP